MVVMLPEESGDRYADGGWFEFAVTAVTPSRSEMTLSYCAFSMRGICDVTAMPGAQVMTFVAPTSAGGPASAPLDPPLPVLDPPLPVLDPPLPVFEPPLPVLDPPLPVFEPPLPVPEPPLPVEPPVPEAWSIFPVQ